jgi:two-component system, chemotaxis family, chemotaxis protein CheY
MEANTMRVLIADDSKAMRMIVLRTLRQSPLTIDEVHEAEDGAEALAAVPTFKPDLILSDWNMPNMTGIEFLTNLRASGNDTTFGFITSESNPAMKELAIAGGASFLLTKPFDAERLAEVVSAVVG